MNLISYTPHTQKQTYYCVHQNGFDLTDAMSKWEAEMWKIENESKYANLKVREVTYETDSQRSPNGRGTHDRTRQMDKSHR